MKLDIAVAGLTPRHAFRISRGEKRTVRNVFVRLRDGDATGHGEASPNAFYGETPDAVAGRLAEARSAVEGIELRTARDIERLWSELWPVLAPSRAAQCALDLALWDLLARREGVTVRELATGQPPQPVVTFCTIGLSSPEELEDKLDELRGFPRIKIKSDAAAALEPVRIVHERTAAELAVDANCAWTAGALPSLAEGLSAMRVRFIEQPLAPAEDERMRRIGAGLALPVFADESCAVEEDVERMPGRFSGFNIKLVKCGGLTPGLRMLRRGRELGLGVMVGCMLESSLLISAGMVIAAEADFADLDGAWLLEDDPCAGLSFDRGALRAAEAPGLGVEPVRAMFSEPQAGCGAGNLGAFGSS